MLKIDSKPESRVVILTVCLVALAGLLVSTASYLRTRGLADSYDTAMQTELQQKGLAYGQTAQGVLNLVASSSPQAFASLVSEAMNDPGFALTQFNANQQGRFQDRPLSLEVWTADPSAPEGYQLLFRRDLPGERVTTSEDPGIPPLVAQTAATGEPATAANEDDKDLHYSFLIQATGQANLIVVATLDASEEFAFISAQRQHAIRDAIIFSASSVAFVCLVGGGLSFLVSRTLTNRKRAEEALRDSELRYRTLASLAPVGIFRLDRQGNNIYNNQRALEIVGVPSDAAMGEVWAQHLHPDDRERVLTEWGEAIAQGLPFQSEYRFVHPDGTAVWVLGEVAAERTTHGGIIGYVGTVIDITERKQMEQGLRESEEKFRWLAETVAAGIFILQGATVRYVNPGVEAITGYSHDELLSMHFSDVIHPEFRQLALERSKARQSGENVPMRYEAKIIKKNGEERWVDFSARLIEYEEQPAVLGTAFDITDQKRAQEMLREQARRDSLTGLLNHAAIIEKLGVLAANEGDGRSHAVAMVDVDGLKAINDTYGHQIGDAALVAVAKALSEPGAFVGRYAGDEFMAVLPGADRSSGERYREAVLEKLASVRLTDPESGSSVPVAATIGLAICPEEAGSIADLIRISDSAMYAAKRQRPVGTAGETLPLPLLDDRAAKMVGEIVPLLTSPGDLSQKLRMVAHRLSVGAGYDAVDFSLFPPEPGVPLAQTTFAPGPGGLMEAWNREQRSDSPEPHPLRLLFGRTSRPVILDDPWNTELLLKPQRDILRAGRLRSVLVAPMIWQDQLVGSLGVASRQEAAFGPRDAQFLAAIATQVTAIVRMATLVDELQASSTHLEQAHEQTVMLLAAAAEAHDETTGPHLRNVRTTTELLGRELGQPEEEARALGLAAALHDIGKIHVPDSVLSNAGRMADEEWELMKEHPVWGSQFLAERPGFELATTIARHHHERWDGTGYPDGLAGEEIPEPATIVTVADAFDAMTSGRPYRGPRSVDNAIAEIRACSGTQFSPRVVEALLRLHERGELPMIEGEASRAA